MTLSQYSSTLLLLYSIIVLSIGFWANKKQDHNGYIIGNRNQGYFSTICSMLAGQFNGGGVFLFFTFGLMFGYGFLWALIGFTMGYLIISLFANKIHKEAKQYGDINIPDLLDRHIGPITKKLSSLIIIGKALLFGTAQLLIAGTIIATLLDLPKEWGIYLTATIICVYLYMGGYLTVLKTDIVQWGILMSAALSALIFCPFPKTNILLSDLHSLPNNFFWGFILFTMTLILSNADPWQRVMSAKTAKIGRNSLIASSFIFAIFTFLCITTVKTIALNYHLDQKTAFFSLFENTTLSPFMLAIIGIFTLTAVMSTIDTQAQLFTSTLCKNILNIDPINERQRFIKFSQITTFLLLGILSFVASTVGNSIEFILKAFSFSYILAPILLYAMICKREHTRSKDMTCLIALFIGFSVYTYMFCNGYFQSLLNNIIPAASTLLICIVNFTYEQITNKTTCRH